MKKILFNLFLTVFSFSGFTQSIVAPEPTAIAPLLIGEKVPNISLSDISGKKINLQELAAKKPSVLVFYRGSAIRLPLVICLFRFLSG